MSGEGKNPNPVINFFFCRIVFFLVTSSRVSSFQHLSPWPMRVDHG
jgi:hypothetical protein